MLTFQILIRYVKIVIECAIVAKDSEVNVPFVNFKQYICLTLLVLELVLLTLL